MLVTDRDRVVAEIVPPREGRSSLLAGDLMADAVRKGWVTTAPVLAGGPPPPRLPVAPLADLLRELEADRAGR